MSNLGARLNLGLVEGGRPDLFRFPRFLPICSDLCDFHTPPVLGGAALFDNSAPAVYKTQGP